ncbi:MAG: protein Tex [Bacteroidota bacterium]|nr:protein Tex [Bacteroidota bacterium]
MTEIQKYIADELNIKLWQAENALALKAEGSTIPFIARYRKERTGELDENVLRDLFDRYEYLTELEERKKTILESIESQGKLTDELKAKIEACMKKNELEDLYLPYKPKKRTRATMAKEKGLEPLAILIKEHNRPGAVDIDLSAAAAAFVSEEKGVADVKEALAGASDIIAEEISENAELRAWVREYFNNNGLFASRIKEEYPEGTTKYEMYRNFEAPVKSIAPHNMLALRRGESEGIIMLDLKYDEAEVQSYLESKNIFTNKTNITDFLKFAVKDSFNRLMKISLTGEVRLAKKAFADEQSITVFESNLRQMLLASPAGMKPTIGIDPGFRTGCKLVVLDRTGKFLEYHAIFPFNSEYEKAQAADILISSIKRYSIELIAIGNGTAGREADEFVGRIIEGIEPKPVKVMLSEAGASVYSASKLAGEEFPELDITVRGAISIARRLQDPLAELVKIDPKSIGVGQYQHDVDQKLLRKKLEETIESCVNFVGVDLNTASKELLTYVSGLSPSVSKNIIKYRDEKGIFRSRQELLKVSGFGPKAFEQAAGFLRIRDGLNELDNTAVHPESYYIVERIAGSLEVPLNLITRVPEQLKTLDYSKFITDKVGEPTLRDIISELEKPGRDPREVFKYAVFSDGITAISHLKPGMELEGVVTNITNFGAFVDIGVHQDGLVHISEISHTYVKEPAKALKVGQIVKVVVVEVNENLKRIALSIKRLTKPPERNNNERRVQKAEKNYSVNDLQSRFKR